MKSWKDDRNYRKVKNSNGEVLAYIITVDGVDVSVSEEIYTVYSKMDRRERYLNGESALGTILSLEQMDADEMHPEYLGAECGPSAEEVYLQYCDDIERMHFYDALPLAMEALNADERELIHALFYARVSATAYAKKKGVSEMAIRKRRDRVLKKIKNFLMK